MDLLQSPYDLVQEQKSRDPIIVPQLRFWPKWSFTRIDLTQQWVIGFQYPLACRWGQILGTNHINWSCCSHRSSILDMMCRGALSFSILYIYNYSKVPLIIFFILPQNYPLNDLISRTWIVGDPTISQLVPLRAARPWVGDGLWRKKVKPKKVTIFLRKKFWFKPVYNTNSRMERHCSCCVFVACHYTCKSTTESHPEARRCQLWSVCSPVTAQKSIDFLYWGFSVGTIFLRKLIFSHRVRLKRLVLRGSQHFRRRIFKLAATKNSFFETESAYFFSKLGSQIAQITFWP